MDTTSYSGRNVNSRRLAWKTLALGCSCSRAAATRAQCGANSIASTWHPRSIQAWVTAPPPQPISSTRVCLSRPSSACKKLARRGESCSALVRSSMAFASTGEYRLVSDASRIRSNSRVAAVCMAVCGGRSRNGECHTPSSFCWKLSNGHAGGNTASCATTRSTMSSCVVFSICSWARNSFQSRAPEPSAKPRLNLCRHSSSDLLQ